MAKNEPRIGDESAHLDAVGDPDPVSASQSTAQEPFPDRPPKPPGIQSSKKKTDQEEEP